MLNKIKEALWCVIGLGIMGVVVMTIAPYVRCFLSSLIYGVAK